jgi:hypothetical protein
MPRLSRAQQEARQQIIGLVGSGLYPEQLASKLLAALLKAVPADGGGEKRPAKHGISTRSILRAILGDAVDIGRLSDDIGKSDRPHKIPAKHYFCSLQAIRSIFARFLAR